MSGSDGSIDWWCVPNLDSPPLFDRLLDPVEGGFFEIAARSLIAAVQRYRPESNVLETTVTTANGRAKIVESLNSGSAGRLPWCELARRIEGIEGQVIFDIRLRLGHRAGTASPYIQRIGPHDVFHVARVLGIFLRSEGVTVKDMSDDGVSASCEIRAGQRELVAIIAGQDEPLVAPSVEEVSARIDRSDEEWRTWSTGIAFDGPLRPALIRNALALKLLLFSPSGAIAAAATTSLPERLGGSKNYDYRYAWVRDAGYTIKAFLQVGAQAEAKAALTWLLNQLDAYGTRVCYSVWGGIAPDLHDIDLPGYHGSKPVVRGNRATSQWQHDIFGDIFETAARFVDSGNILDRKSAETLTHIADACADMWRQMDNGIWELEEKQHYTMSKISCWQALARAVELADAGQLPTTCRDRWSRERDRIEAWIEDHCWSETMKAYTFYPGSDRLDASIALAVRFGFDGRGRLRSTLDAIDQHLGHGALHYRYSGASDEEACFLACTFWMVEAKVLLGQRDDACRTFEKALATLGYGSGIYAEMLDVETGRFLGNMPQGLTHLAIIQAIMSLNDPIRSGKTD